VEQQQNLATEVQPVSAIPAVQPPASAVIYQAPKPDEYAAVEIFGHRQHVGQVDEIEFAGTKLLRVRVPIDGSFANGVVEYRYGGGAIFSLRPCTRAQAEEANRPWSARYSDGSPAGDGEEAGEDAEP
jgi:hypothetical protein